MTRYLGYCCINNTLRNTKPSVFTGRSMTLKSFNIIEASNKALQNVKDLYTILQWNEQHNIKCFRIGSDIFPRATCSVCNYDIEQLPDIIEIKTWLLKCGQFAIDNKHILSMHPGPYTTLASPNSNALSNGIKEYMMHVHICKLIDPNNILDIPINIHIGGSYGQTFTDTATRFINTFNSLPDDAKKYLVLENDDKQSCWSVKNLYELIYKNTNIPITLDLHHWLFLNDGNELEHDFNICKQTWNNRCQQIHYSQSPTPDKLIPAHSDYYRNSLPIWLYNYDNWHCHLECKAKELALIDYRLQFSHK